VEYIEDDDTAAATKSGGAADEQLPSFAPAIAAAATSGSYAVSSSSVLPSQVALLDSLYAGATSLFKSMASEQAQNIKEQAMADANALIPGNVAKVEHAPESSASGYGLFGAPQSSAAVRVKGVKEIWGSPRLAKIHQIHGGYMRDSVFVASAAGRLRLDTRVWASDDRRNTRIDDSEVWRVKTAVGTCSNRQC
jgi:hypothetical protein